jgi:nucleoside 2-deoxyribosyltransferase
MKTVFVCYALERGHMSELRERLSEIENGALASGWRSYAHVRDGQNWQFHDAPIRDILEIAFKRIAASDAVLLDLTSHANSKRVGLNIEAGYAKALGKPIMAVYRAGDRPNMTTDLASHEIAYDRVDELAQVVTDLLCRISVSESASG